MISRTSSDALVSQSTKRLIDPKLTRNTVSPFTTPSTPKTQHKEAPAPDVRCSPSPKVSALRSRGSLKASQLIEKRTTSHPHVSPATPKHGSQSSAQSPQVKRGVKSPASGNRGVKTGVSATSGRAQPTKFRLAYEKGDLPVQVHHGSGGSKKRVKWAVNVDELDYKVYLPLFFDGLREKQDPYRLLAVQGSHDMLEFGGVKVVEIIPSLIPPLRAALNTQDSETLIATMKTMQKLIASHEAAGIALIGYYRQLLPVFNTHKGCHLKPGDEWNFSDRLRQTLGETIEETLSVMESSGGEGAFVNIKYMIPTYESCGGRKWCFNRKE